MHSHDFSLLENSVLGDNILAAIALLRLLATIAVLSPHTYLSDGHDGHLLRRLFAALGGKVCLAAAWRTGRVFLGGARGAGRALLAADVGVGCGPDPFCVLLAAFMVWFPPPAKYFTACSAALAPFFPTSSGVLSASAILFIT